MKISYKFSLFDVDVGSIVDEEVFNTAKDARAGVESIIWCYEMDPSFADEREINENKDWDYKCDAIKEILSSKFFDSVSIWLPGHHRKIIITKIEEND